jgi:hypothetical protein
MLPTSLPLIYANERVFVYREKFCTKQGKWKYKIGRMSNFKADIYIYVQRQEMKVTNTGSKKQII